MKKAIEFQTSTNDMNALWARRKSPAYEDLILVDDLQKYRHRFEPGKTKIRIVPALTGSSYWMLGVHALRNENARHAHPRTTQPGVQSVFDLAYKHLKDNRPALLFSRSNKNGIRLLPSPMSLSWMIVEDANGIKLRLLLGSHYDGVRGGASGIGHMVCDQVLRAGLDSNEPGHPLNPLDGTSLCVERIGGDDTKFPSYRVSLTTDRSPLQSLLDRVTEVEYDALCPLEKAIRLVEPEHEWRLLAKVVGDELMAEIRAAQEGNNTEENTLVKVARGELDRTPF